MYKPCLNDYVQWTKGVEGWIYFVDQSYITIEARVIPKDEPNLQACSLHKNNRVLVLCYPNQWNELKVIGYRKDKYSEVMCKV
jgi:hypothetical protein